MMTDVLSKRSAEQDDELGSAFAQPSWRRGTVSRSLKFTVGRALSGDNAANGDRVTAESAWDWRVRDGS